MIWALISTQPQHQQQQDGQDNGELHDRLTLAILFTFRLLVFQHDSI
jgi:hypothetical protein